VKLNCVPGEDKEIAKKIMNNRPYVTVEGLARSGIPVEARESATMRVTVSSQAPASETGTADRKNARRQTK
jgi:hypothetical protein